MDQIPCPDGYLLDRTSPLAEAHLALSNYLVRYEDAGWKTAAKELNALRDKRHKLRIWMALLDRLDWLHTNHPDNPSFSQLRDITYGIETWKLAPAEADLIAILRQTARMAAFVTPYAPMPHLMAYVEEHGLTPALSAAIREFDTPVRKGKYKLNQVRSQLLNSRLDMLAWRDEWNEVNLKRCWSEQIRADFRSMHGGEREDWRRLLHSIDGDEGVRPAPAWLRNAASRIESLGPASFRDHLVRWFAPLRPGHTQPLSREGSFILRSFIWLAQSLNDADLTASVGGIAEVEFKPKKNGEKVVRAASEAIGKVDPVEGPRTPLPSLDTLTARALGVVLSAQSAGGVSPEIAERVRMDSEIVYIRGDLDTYRMHISTGAIFRESDGRRVHVAIERTSLAGTPGNQFGGVGELLTQILILAEDSRHAQSLAYVAES
jgi:hypothetical protein